MHPAIEAKGLSHRYGRTEALHNLSLSIPQGSITALLGPNGAGKSTLLKLLVGLLKPRSGSSTVLGLDSARLKSADFARLGYSSDDQRVPTWMTLARLMDYCRDLYPTWDDKLAGSLVTLFALPTDKPLERMSRGMRAKASLISSLAYRPELLLLDEPLSGIDILTREEIMQGVLELVTSEKGLTLLLSSHEIDDVERLCDWVVILMQGKLRACESLESLQGRTRFVEISGSLPVTRATLPADCWLDPKRQAKAVRLTHFNWNESNSLASLEAFYPGCEINVESLSLRQIYRAYALRFDNAES